MEFVFGTVMEVDGEDLELFNGRLPVSQSWDYRRGLQSRLDRNVVQTKVDFALV